MILSLAMQSHSRPVHMQSFNLKDCMHLTLLDTDMVSPLYLRSLLAIIICCLGHVESPNKGHFRTDGLLFFVRRLSSLGDSKCMYYNYREKIFGPSSIWQSCDYHMVVMIGTYRQTT